MNSSNHTNITDIINNQAGSHKTACDGQHTVWSHGREVYIGRLYEYEEMEWVKDPAHPWREEEEWYNMTRNVSTTATLTSYPSDIYMCNNTLAVEYASGNTVDIFTLTINGSGVDAQLEARRVKSYSRETW